MVGKSINTSQGAYRSISIFIVTLSIAVLVANRLIMAPCKTFELLDQKHKTFLITGASSGLGLETARVLAEKVVK